MRQLRSSWHRCSMPRWVGSGCGVKRLWAGKVGVVTQLAGLPGLPHALPHSQPLSAAAPALAAEQLAAIVLALTAPLP